MSVFFTSDQHYEHKNMIRYCNRPFKHVNEMKRTLIRNHNSVVTEEDETYHMGDFSMLGPDRHKFFEEVLEKTNGTHHLIVGNHDKCKPLSYVNFGFESVHTSLHLELKSYKFILGHDPAMYEIIKSKYKNNIMLCGHIHTLFKTLLPEEKIINVGVDIWNFTPVSLEQIITLIKETET